MSVNTHKKAMPGEIITPIGSEQREQVVARTQEYLEHAGRELGRNFAAIAVSFGLSGRSAGMYCVHGDSRIIRYNPWLFARYFEDSLRTTVPHETAHYIADVLYGTHSIRPHGPEWRSIMQLFGAEPRVCGNYDLEGIPVRRQRRFDYVCSCRSHELTTVRHRRVLYQRMKYFCRYCKDELVYAGHTN